MIVYLLADKKLRRLLKLLLKNERAITDVTEFQS